MATTSIVHPINTVAENRFDSWNRRLKRELIMAYHGAPLVRRKRSNLLNSVVWRIHRGQVQVTYAGRKTIAKAGHWFSPGQQFAQIFSKDAEITSIHFTCEWAAGGGIFPPGPVTPISAESCPQLDDIAGRLTTILPQIPPEGLRVMDSVRVSIREFLEAESCFQLWLANWISILEANKVEIKGEAGTREDVHRAVNFIKSHPLDRKLDMAALGKAAGLGRTTLMTRYTEKVGLTPLAHFDKIRLEAAQSALSSGSEQVKAVAFRLGFKNMSQFSNWFHRRTGKSPREFREDFHDKEKTG